MQNIIFLPFSGILNAPISTDMLNVANETRLSRVHRCHPELVPHHIATSQHKKTEPATIGRRPKLVPERATDTTNPLCYELAYAPISVTCSQWCLFRHNSATH
eukprot:5794855-Pleurochrysis_carterae.AAC.1